MAKKIAGETPPTWLSEIVKGVLDKHMVFRFRRTKAIAAEIVKHTKGKTLKNNPGPDDAIRHGLEAAENRQHELEENPKLMTGSPSHEAARVIAERLGITLD